MKQRVIHNHCAYGVYSPQLSATAVPPMSKDPDNRIRERDGYQAFLCSRFLCAVSTLLRPPLKKVCFQCSGWPKLWPLGRPQFFFFRFFVFFFFLGGGGGGGKKITKMFGKTKKIEIEGKKRSKSAQIFSPGRWTGNKLFLRVALWQKQAGQGQTETTLIHLYPTAPHHRGQRSRSPSPPPRSGSVQTTRDQRHQARC